MINISAVDRRLSPTKILQSALTLTLLLTLSACVDSSKKSTSSPDSGVGAGNPPTLVFSASPSHVTSSGTTTLTWSAAGADTCNASGLWSGEKAVQGSENIGGIVQAGTFTLKCSGAGVDVSKDIAVTVAMPAPTITFTATPNPVAMNTATTLAWSSTDADQCVGSGAWSGAKNASGSFQTELLASERTYTLTCSGSGGATVKSVQVTINAVPVVPAITFSASLTSVAYGASSTLTWSSSNATTCTASGAWSGTQTANGTLTLTALKTTGTYTLTCTGIGGSSNKSITITVQAPLAPTVTLTANPTSVAYNGASTLTWSSTSTTLCTGSGAWDGNKATSGTLSLTSLTSSVTYVLSCSGAGGSASATATITVVSGAAGTITGSVDSSRINRSGVNKVYLYAGTVTPDDYDGGADDPMASATVAQDENSCGFSYNFANVVPGNYTIAFTNQAASDVLGQNNTIAFIGTTAITVGASAITQDFTAARVLRVGSGKAYATPSLAGAAAQDGDVVEIEAGEYLDDSMIWRKHNLTLRGVGGRPHIKGTKLITDGGTDVQNGKGLWVLYGQNTVVENIEFSGARVAEADGFNGAGIRADANGLIVCNSYFHDNENGILGGGGEVLIEYSEFNHNGLGQFGYTHNLYIDNKATSKLVFRHNYSHHAVEGHELKSKAAENYILYNRLSNEDGAASYNIDIPFGGLTYIVGNLIQQGSNSPNSGIVYYAGEGLEVGRTDNLYLVANTLVNNKGSGTFVTANAGTKVIRLINNLFVGSGTEVTGANAVTTKISNLNTPTPNFVNSVGYDYRLTATSPVINQGSDPGTLNGFDAWPVYQYVHPAKREVRPSNGVYDIGAYEYVP